MGFFSFFSKEKKETLDKGLSKTKESVFSKIARAVAGKSKVDDEVLDNLEEVLITSDVGVETTLNIIKRIEKRAAADKYVNTQELNHILRDEIAALLTENNSDDVADFDVPIEKKPYVMMVVGVNGVGKTTTIGKLAYQFKKAGKSVYLGAADTFRAAAVEQLMIWGERVARVRIPPSPPNKNRNFDTKRIGVTVLTFWQKRRVCGTFAPSGPKRKPGQVVFMVGFLPLRGLRGPRNR